MSDTDTRNLFFSPAESATRLKDYLHMLATRPKIDLFGHNQLSKAILPLPGDVIGIIGRPGHGKTTLAAIAAIEAAKRIADEDLAEKEISVFISFEQAIERIEVLLHADRQHSTTDILSGKFKEEEILQKNFERVGLPVWVAGRSIIQPKPFVRMTLQNLYDGLAKLYEEFGIKPRLICLDYIQIVPVVKEKDPVEQITDAMKLSKEVALRLSCINVIGVQAGRAVDTRSEQIPNLSDCQWASAIEQIGNVLISLHRPALTGKKRLTMPDGTELDITKELLLYRILKQTSGEAGETGYMYFAPQYVQLANMELDKELRYEQTQAEL